MPWQVWAGGTLTGNDNAIVGDLTQDRDVDGGGSASLTMENGRFNSGSHEITNAVVSIGGGKLDIAGTGRLTIVNAGRGFARVEVNGDADIAGHVLVQASSSSNNDGNAAASMGITGLTKITGGSVNVNVQSGARGMAVFESDGKVTMTDGSIKITSAASATTLDATATGAYFLAKGGMEMSGGSIEVAATGTNSVATLKTTGEFKMTGGDVVVKGASTSGWASVEADIFSISGGTLVVGETAASRSLLAVRDRLDISGTGAMEIAGAGTGSGVIQLDGGNRAVTVGSGAVLRTAAGALVQANGGAGSFTVAQGGTLDLAKGPLTLNNTLNSIQGDLVVGAGAGGMNTLTTNSATTVAGKDNIKLGSTVWTNWGNIAVNQELIDTTTGALNIDGSETEWSYSNLVGEMTVAKSGNALTITRMAATALGSSGALAGKLGSLGYDAEKFGDGALGALSGVIAGMQGDPCGPCLRHPERALSEQNMDWRLRAVGGRVPAQGHRRLQVQLRRLHGRV